MKNLFTKTFYGYRNRIIIGLTMCLLMSVLAETMAQGIKISGTITDEESEPLVGALVVEKNSTNGTISDVNGQYELNVSDENTSLVFSFVGYDEREEAINGRSRIDVSLIPKVLEEVVVLGYSTERKRDLSGSTSSVDSEEIEKVVTPSIDQALQGRTAGLLVSNASGGSPGAAPTVRIRGSNSVNSGNEPLYVIDGLPIYPSNGAIRGGNDFQTDQLSPNTSNILATINPNDIASIEVLKDASATAIYGARGANGVIVITTKRGQEQSNQLNVDFFTGVSTISNDYPLLNASQYARLLNDYNEAFGGDPAFTQEQIAAFDNGAGTNWQDQVFRQAPVNNLQISTSGGNQNLQHFLSAGYYNEQGIVKGSGLQRYSLRANIDAKLGAKLKVGNSFTTSFTVQEDVPTGQRDPGTGPGVILSMLDFPPTDPVYNPDGSYFLFPSRSGLAIANPRAIVETQDITYKSLRSLGTFFGEYEILPGLTGRINLGYDLLSRKEDSFYPKASTLLGAEVGGLARVGNILDLTWMSDFLVTYNKTFGRHRINAVTGFTAQANMRERTLTGRSNFVTDAFGSYNLAGGATEIIPQSSKDEWSLMGLIGRVNYVLSDKYIFTFSGRYDGSSRFGENNKYSFFPSGAVAWRVSDEAFMDGANFVDDLKLRASYGITGNQEIGLYRSLPRYITVGEVFGNNTAVGIRPAPNGIPNPDLTWEQTSQLDIGTDFVAWNGRLSITADYYRKETSDLIFEFPVAIESGYSSVLRNSGSVENEGYELSVATNFNLGKVGVSVSGNYTHNTNRITDLGGRDTLLIGNNGRAFIIGEDISSVYGLQFNGIWQLGEEDEAGVYGRVPGDPKYEDVNGDNAYDLANDRQVLGMERPTSFYGLNTAFNYQGIELSIFFQGSAGNIIRGGTVSSGFGGLSNNYIASANYWTPENPSNTIRSLKSTDPLGTAVSSNEFEKADYLRLRSVTLAYNLPNSVLDKIGLSKLRIYVSGQNLLTFTNYTGQDPEIIGNPITRGNDAGNYPLSTAYRLGLNIGF